MGESSTMSLGTGSTNTLSVSQSSSEDVIIEKDPPLFRETSRQRSSFWMSWGSNPFAPNSSTFSSGSSISVNEDNLDDFDDIQQPTTADTTTAVAEPNVPLSLEGTLSFRKSRSATGSSAWKQGYVVLNLTDGGSLTCFREKPRVKQQHQQQQSTTKAGSKTLFSRRRQRSAPGDTRPQLPGNSLLDHVLGIVNDAVGSTGRNETNLRFHLSASVQWMAKEIESCSSEFVIEIPTNELHGGTTGMKNLIEWIQKEYQADAIAGRPVRLYFRCARKSVEKALWMQALEQIDRLSDEIHSKRGVQTLFRSNIKVKHRRTRNQLSTLLAREGTSLLVDHSNLEYLHEDDPEYNQPLERVDRRGEKEFLVYPMYAYPNRWMTQREMHAEMLKPSETFHDLRNTGSSGDKEIGVLKVEVLECIGLPALDFASETDAVVYFVCGSCAFTTDVIWNRLNPKWLPKSRRACIFPIYHAYQLLYCGVFDDDGVREKDDFAGRVTVALSRLRPRSTYDVTLPLRMSSKVYSRRPRGSIRLRFSIEWHSERDALLSYIPKTIRHPPKTRPDNDVTILCADEKAFRNVAMTVHGIHMPGRFTPHEFKASMREMNFARKVAMNTARDLILETVLWKNPVLSGMIFCAWMHTVSSGSFSLVPFYITFFLFLAMIRTYCFFGSDGPIQQGFVPPSLEEMTAALLASKDTKFIEPLRIAPTKHFQTGGSRTSHSVRSSQTEPITHTQQGKWLFRFLGFKSETSKVTHSDFYHMEFPFAQGLRDPISGKIRYKKYSVQESLVLKSKRTGKKPSLSVDDDNETLMDDFFGSSQDSVIDLEQNRRHSLERLSSFSGEVRRRKSAPAWVLSSRKSSYSNNAKSSYEDLPPRLRIPDQDIDAKVAKKKRLTEDLDELRENLHRFTLHMFNDRTHVRPNDGAMYFRSNKKSRKSAAALEADLERLLGIGPYSSTNPVIARVGLYMEPIIDSLQSVICVTRVVYNILTWRDPMLSFWFTMLLFVAALVLFLFPWRLFLFVTGVLVCGPQNWLLQALHEKGMAPALQQKLSKRFTALHIRNKSSMKRNEKIFKEKQLIFCGHTSDNSAPRTLNHGDVDPKSLHQVCIPYSQLNGTTRFYDWPPEPQYAKCTPSSVQEPLTSSSRKSRVGTPPQSSC